jgi:hypothetical protein
MFFGQEKLFVSIGKTIKNKKFQNSFPPLTFASRPTAGESNTHSPHTRLDPVPGAYMSFRIIGK